MIVGKQVSSCLDVGVKTEHTVGVQNKDFYFILFIFFFQTAYLIVMRADKLAKTKVITAKTYSFVVTELNDMHGKLHKKNQFCYKVCRICQFVI